MIESILLACTIALILIAVLTTKFGFIIGCLIVAVFLAFIVGAVLALIEIVRRGARRIVRGFN